MKLAALLSGGKDSLYAAYIAKKQGHEITTIISIESENPESYMFHVPNIKLVEMQAKSMGIDIVKSRTKGEKEKELDDLRDAIACIKNIDGIVTGALASNYQKTRIDNICSGLGITSFAPLWHMDQEKYLRFLIEDKFSSIFIAVAAPPLDEKWLGRMLDSDALKELIELNAKHQISIVGEGGEYDTFVVDCPLFEKKINVTETENIWDNRTRSGFMNIIRAELVDKNIL